MQIKINFEEFIDNNISGKFVINPFWLEHLLNLFYQGYPENVWMEITDTKINHGETLDNIGYGIITQELNKARLPRVGKN